MSWMCVGCSTQHHDGMDGMGFGLCKTCADKARAKKAKEKAAMLAARKKKKN